MDMTVEKIAKLLSWIEINKNLGYRNQILIDSQSVLMLKGSITDISQYYAVKKPYYSDELNRINNNINVNQFGTTLNSILFAQIHLLLKMINQDIMNDSTFWKYMHPDLSQKCKSSFESNDFVNCVRTAFIELASRVRSFRKNQGLDEITSDTNMIRNTFKNPEGILTFTNCSSDTEKNIQKGYENLFAGSMEAIRNSVSHENVIVTEEECARKIMFASDLMYMLDVALDRYYSNEN